MRQLHLRSAVVVWLLCQPFGCRSDLPEVQWEGEHILFAADHPEQVCGGTLEYLDRRTGQVLERLGTEPDKITYYFLDDIDEYCPFDSIAVGCGTIGVVYSELVPHIHEIVHARSSDRMPPVLEEGLAEYLGDPYPVRGKLAPRDRLAELLVSNERLVDPQEYARAAHFVAFLVENFGWDNLLELDANVTRESTSVQLDAAFQAVFGLDINGMLETYDDFPDCTGNVDTSAACLGPSVPRDNPWVSGFERVVDCASAEGVGPHHGNVFVEGVIEVEPSIDGGRIVSALGDGMDKGGFVVFRRCGPCTENGVGRIGTKGSYFVSEQELPAGRYLVQLYLPVSSGPAVIGIEING